jgi:arsenite methyltransferase
MSTTDMTSLSGATEPSLDPVVAEIAQRYSTLAESSCCLSCGGAADRAKPQPGEVCVDLGSGRGTDVLRMADEVGADGFVWGIDISDGMLEKARATAVRLGTTNVRFEKAELEHLPIPTRSVDLVISNCVLNHARDKAATWGEIARILKPGGRFVVSDIYSSAPVPDKFRQDPEAVAECWAGADTREVYLATVRGAGFSDISVLEESAPYPKGSIEVSSFTLQGWKPEPRRCCGG